jgi:Uma2 family endonuclease
MLGWASERKETAMGSASAVHSPETDRSWGELVRAWEEAQAPEGWKAEIIEGQIVMSPSPREAHNEVADEIQRQLYRVLPDTRRIYQNQGVVIPSRSGLFIPDLVVLPKPALRADQGAYVPAGEAELAVEITSRSGIRQDRIDKPAGYATAGVPLHLLVDFFGGNGPAVTLYGEPADGVYRTLFAGKFGDPVPLPEPFGIALDTSEFPLP